MPLRRVNAPGILHGASMPLVSAHQCPSLGYIIFIKSHHPPMPFVDTSTHCLLHQLPPSSLLGSSMPATAHICPRHLVSSFFCFCFVLPRSHSFHACVSHPHPTWHHPPPPPVSSSCIDAQASSSTPLALAASMPRPRTHYLYYRLDID